MALPWRERMLREVERLEAARARLVHAGRQRPDDVRVAIVLGKGQYLAAADRERYERLGAELHAVSARLEAAGVLLWERHWIGGASGRDVWRAGAPPYWLIEAPPEQQGDPATAEARRRHLDQDHPQRAGGWELWRSAVPLREGDQITAWRCLSFHPTLESAQAAAELIAGDPGLMADLVAGRFQDGAFPPAAVATTAVSAAQGAGAGPAGGDRRQAEAPTAVSGPQNGPASLTGRKPEVPAAAGATVRVPITEAQAAVVGFRFLDNDDPAGIVLDGAAMAYPLERGAYIVETLEFYADQLARNPDGLDGHRERRSTLALARKVREANAAARSPAPTPVAEPGDQVADVAPPVARPPAPAVEPATSGIAAPAWGLGDTVLIANPYGDPYGDPKPAQVLAENPGRPGVVKVKYLASRTAAWVARARVLGPAPADVAAPEPEPDVQDQVADPVPAGPAGGEPAAAGALALLARPDVQDLLDRFLNRRKASTIEAYRRDLAYFAAWLGLPPREAVARLLACDQGQANRLLDHYAAHMRSTAPAARSGSTAARLSPATVNRRLAAVRSLVKMARLHGLVSWTVDVEGERVESYRDTRGPGLPAVRRLVEELDEAEGAQRPKAGRDRALLRLMWDLGLRRGELVELDLAHLDVEAGRLSVLGKGREERVWLDLPEQTLEALELWLIHRGELPGPLFCTVAKGGRVLPEKRISGTDVYRVLAARGRRTGARVRPHGVRHSSITSVLEASGGDRRLGQTHGRHRDSRVTDRYDDARANLGGKAACLAASLL